MFTGKDIVPIIIPTAHPAYTFKETRILTITITGMVVEETTNVLKEGEDMSATIVAGVMEEVMATLMAAAEIATTETMINT